MIEDCPFCGNEPTSYYCAVDRSRTMVRCEIQSCPGYYCLAFMEDWNKRAYKSYVDVVKDLGRRVDVENYLINFAAGKVELTKEKALELAGKLGNGER